ncbi:putative symporter YidK [Mannheimia haemolytica]
MLLTIITFLVVTGLVGYISWQKTRNDDLSTSKGYFLAGRGLSATIIGCSMVLTSLSTEQLIGVNANSYAGNFSIIAWDCAGGHSALLLGTLSVAEIYPQRLHHHSGVL